MVQAWPLPASQFRTEGDQGREGRVPAGSPENCDPWDGGVVPLALGKAGWGRVYTEVTLPSETQQTLGRARRGEQGVQSSGEHSQVLRFCLFVIGVTPWRRLAILEGLCGPNSPTLSQPCQKIDVSLPSIHMGGSRIQTAPRTEVHAPRFARVPCPCIPAPVLGTSVPGTRGTPLCLGKTLPHRAHVLRKTHTCSSPGSVARSGH